MSDPPAYDHAPPCIHYKSINSPFITSSLIHQILLLFLLLLNQRINQRVEECIECRVDGRAALLNASIEHPHIRSCLECFWLLVFGGAGQMLTEGYALRDWNVECLRELLNPGICLSLRLGIIAIKHHDHSLSLFLDAWPHSLILYVACITHSLPDTSQNSMETRRLSTSVSCSTIRTELVGR